MPEYPLLDLRTQRPASGHYVYRFCGDAGDLLYVGSTNNFWIRAGRHIQEHAEWWPDVDWSQTILELVSADPCQHRLTCKLPGHEEMLRHEESLIRSLQPRYNLRLTGWCRRGLHLLAEHGRMQRNGHIGCYTCQLERMKEQYHSADGKAKRAERRRMALRAAGQIEFPV